VVTGTRPIDALKRFWWIVVVFAAAGAVIGGLPAPENAADSITRYTATHTILVSSTSENGGVFADPLLFNQIQLFATTGEVPGRAAAAIDYADSGAALAAQVTVTADQQNGALQISTTQTTADQAERIANAIGDELITYLAERQDTLRDDRLASNLTRLDELEKQVQEAETTAQSNVNDRVAAAQLDALERQYSVAFEQFNILQADEGQLVLTTLQRAQPVAITEQGLSAPRSRVGRAVLGGIAGLAVGIGLVLLLARSDRRIRNREQAEQILGLKASAIVPDAPKHDVTTLSVRPDRHDPLSDSYRTMRSVISFIDNEHDRDAKHAAIVVVVSPGQGDGKTSVSANLVAAFVEAGDRTVAVNSDFRRPALSKRLIGYEPTPSGENLRSLETGPLQMAILPTDDKQLVLLDLAGMAGQSPSDLARSTGKILRRLVNVADSIVVDTSPVGATAEVLEFVPVADTVLVVVRLGHTSITSARRTIDMIRTLSTGEILLVIVGGSSEDSAYYYYEPPKTQGRFRRKKPADTPPAPVSTNGADSFIGPTPNGNGTSNGAPDPTGETPAPDRPVSA
jgi:Mrp family chromosome partitioning ATPase